MVPYRKRLEKRNDFEKRMKSLQFKEIFEIDGRHESDGTMNPVAIVETLDEIEDFEFGGLEISENLDIDQFFFENGIERLHRGIVDWRTLWAG